MTPGEAFIQLFALASQHLGDIATSLSILNLELGIIILFMVIGFFAKRDR